MHFFLLFRNYNTPVVSTSAPHDAQVHDAVTPTETQLSLDFSISAKATAGDCHRVPPPLVAMSPTPPQKCTRLHVNFMSVFFSIIHSSIIQKLNLIISESVA